MPYSPAHKEQSRLKILDSAYQLFTLNGFDKITVNQVMKDCQLTRGAFYAHFTSKGELYTAALKHGGTKAQIVKKKPDALSDKEWLGILFDGYLSIEHVEGQRPCPLAFLSTDIATRDDDAKKAYRDAYKSLNKRLLAYINRYTTFGEQELLALTAMMIGTVTIARTVNNKKLALSMLASCRKAINEKLDGV